MIFKVHKSSLLCFSNHILKFQRTLFSFLVSALVGISLYYVSFHNCVYTLTRYGVVVLMGLISATIICYIRRFVVPITKCHIIGITWALVICLINVANP